MALIPQFLASVINASENNNSPFSNLEFSTKSYFSSERQKYYGMHADLSFQSEIHGKIQPQHEIVNQVDILLLFHIPSEAYVDIYDLEVSSVLRTAAIGFKLISCFRRHGIIWAGHMSLSTLIRITWTANLSLLFQRITTTVFLIFLLVYLLLEVT